MGYYSFNRPRRDGRLSWPKQRCIALARACAFATMLLTRNDGDKSDVTVTPKNIIIFGSFFKIFGKMQSGRVCFRVAYKVYTEGINALVTPVNVGTMHKYTINTLETTCILAQLVTQEIDKHTPITVIYCYGYILLLQWRPLANETVVY